MVQSTAKGYDIKPSSDAARDTTVTITCDNTYFELRTDEMTVGIPRQYAMKVLARAFEEETSTS